MTTQHAIQLQSGAVYHSHHDESLEYRMNLMMALWSNHKTPKPIQDNAEQYYYKYKKQWLEHNKQASSNPAK